MREELAASRADEKRYAVEEIDRPVRNDRPRQKWNAGFPVEDKGADVRAPARQPVRESVAGKEERAEEAEPAERGAPGTRLCESKRFGAGNAHVRAASATVKMPQSSVHWSIFSKPA